MSFLPIFAELVLLLFLILVLAAHRLFWRDPLFTTYLCTVWIGACTLLVLSQFAWEWRGYADVYLAVNFIALGLGLGFLYAQRASWVVAGAFLLFGAMRALGGARPSMQQWVGLFAAVLLAMGIAGCILSRRAADPFHEIALLGLGLFWLTHSIPSFLYWYSQGRTLEAARFVSNAEGVIHAVVFAWMALAFAGMALQPSARALPEVDAASAVVATAAALARRRS